MKGGSLHSYNVIFIVASDMKPSAGINKGGIPTLQNIVWIFQIQSKYVQSSSCLE